VPVKDSIRRRQPDVPSRRWASLKDAAEYLGVTDRTIRQWITEGKFCGYRCNARLVRVDLNEVDAAMQPFGGDAAS
jgi:excisionase family DNA binding protein